MYNAIRKSIKSNKGITLVALVITVIILIILAGISLSVLFGTDGLIEKAKAGATIYEEEAAKELGELDKVNEFFNTLSVGGSIPTNPPAQEELNVTLTEAQSNSMFTKTINSKYTDTTRATNNVVTIPAGYKMTTDSTKIDDGIVIEDVSGNQWVWIPVDEDMAETITATELGGVGNSGVTTTLKSKSELLNSKTRTNIGETSGFREPDIVNSYDKTSLNASTYLSDAGFTTASTALADFAGDLSNSYKDMIESVAEFGGFYVGRYEITGTFANPTEKKGWPIADQNSSSWYKLYNACTKFTTDSATSRMIWGCQWDEICKFIANKGYTDAKSQEFGNYNSSIDSNGDPVEGRGSKQQTGSKEIWSACNIYDIAGNCWEWTQEASSNYARANRGRRCRRFRLLPCFLSQQ